METNLNQNPPELSSSVPQRSPTVRAQYRQSALTDRIIACAIAVHKELGPGFLESIYEEAFSMELDSLKIAYQRQLPVRIRYKGSAIGMHRIDLVVDNKVVVELKAVKEIDDAHLATCMSYLKATRLEVGLIINFSRAKTQMRRVICTPDWTAEGLRNRDAEGLNKKEFY